ncbi:MAG: CoA-binding protein, partial [Deltaproteobacteria bacterium]|nr:CoA-binding protein [Deltaproteobacteria bacterium]
IFRPASLAIIGSSNNPERWGYSTMDSVLNFSQFRGEVYPVNPREKAVLGIKAYRSIFDVRRP